MAPKRPDSLPAILRFSMTLPDQLFLVGPVLKYLASSDVCFRLTSLRASGSGPPRSNLPVPDNLDPAGRGDGVTNSGRSCNLNLLTPLVGLAAFNLDRFSFHAARSSKTWGLTRFLSAANLFLASSSSLSLAIEPLAFYFSIRIITLPRLSTILYFFVI